MTATTRPTTSTRSTVADAPAAAPGPTRRVAGHEPGRPVERSRWPVFGIAGAVSGFAALIVSMPSLTEEQYSSGVDVVDQLERGGYHAGFVLGLISVGCLFAASSGWKRWAEDRAPRDLAARTIGNGIAAVATVNIIFTCLMGSMALYLPGGTDEGWLSKDALFVNFSLLDFGTMLGWWGAAVAAIATAVLAFRRSNLLPRWMGVVSVLLLAPALLMAAIMGLPGFVGLTMPIWLVAMSVGMMLSKRANGLH